MHPCNGVGPNLQCGLANLSSRPSPCGHRRYNTTTVPSTPRSLARTLSLLRPEDLFPAWRYADLLEDMGKISPREARRWKEGIFGLMVLWGLEPDEVLAIVLDASIAEVHGSPRAFGSLIPL